MDKTVRAIFMFGYSRADRDKVIAWIRTNNAVLVDVRLSPASRVPGWSMMALVGDLGKYPAGSYVHLKEWGNNNYQDKMLPHAIMDFDAGWAVVDEIRRTRPPLVMCGCKAAYGPSGAPACHRGTLADMIAATKRYGEHPLQCGHMDLVFARPSEDEIVGQEGLGI